MITNLQVLRVAAALGVVIYHTGLRINGVSSELMGVAIFFVISGFIMVHITREGAEDFLRRRLIRIVPIYWIITLAAFAWWNFGFANPPYVYPLWFHWLFTAPSNIYYWFYNIIPTLCTKDNAIRLAQSLLFWPTAGDPMPFLSVGWTLNIEMFFYFAFALCLRAGRNLAPLLCAMIFVVLYYFNMSGLYSNKVLATYGNHHVIFFVYGIACYYIWRLLMPAIARYRRTWIGLAVCVLALWPLAIFIPIPLPGMEHFMPPAVVLSTLVLHSANCRVGSRLLIDLGGASYILYLIHLVVMDTLRVTSSAFPILTISTPIGTLVVACVSSLVALMLHYRLERPIQVYLHARLKSSGTAVEVAQVPVPDVASR